MVVLAAAAPQPTGGVLALGVAQFADEALGDHLVEALSVFPGDEDPGEHGKGEALGKWQRKGREGSSNPEPYKPITAEENPAFIRAQREVKQSPLILSCCVLLLSESDAQLVLLNAGSKHLAKRGTSF